MGHIEGPLSAMDRFLQAGQHSSGASDVLDHRAQRRVSRKGRKGKASAVSVAPCCLMIF